MSQTLQCPAQGYELWAEPHVGGPVPHLRMKGGGVPGGHVSTGKGRGMGEGGFSDYEYDGIGQVYDLV